MGPIEIVAALRFAAENVWRRIMLTDKRSNDKDEKDLP